MVMIREALAQVPNAREEDVETIVTALEAQGFDCEAMTVEGAFHELDRSTLKDFGLNALHVAMVLSAQRAGQSSRPLGVRLQYVPYIGPDSLVAWLEPGGGPGLAYDTPVKCTEVPLMWRLRSSELSHEGSYRDLRHWWQPCHPPSWWLPCPATLADPVLGGP